MAHEYDQKIKRPENLNNEEFMSRRYSAITENETVQRRGSEAQYLGRRNKALRKMHSGQKEQDAAILSAIHDEDRMSADNWSIGAKHRIRNTSYIPAKQVAMTIHESNQQQNNIRRLDSPIPNEQNNINNNNNNNNNKQSVGSSIESNISSQADFQINNSNNSNNNGNNNNGNLQHAPSTSTISRTSTNSKYNDEDIYSEMEFEKFKPSICVHFIMFILITVLCGGAFYYYYLYEWPHKIYYKMSYAAILWFLCVLFLFLNLIDKFHKFHEFFSGLCNHRGGMIFIGLTIIFGLMEYILWSLVDEKLLLTESHLGSVKYDYTLIIIDIIYYFVFLFLFCASMSNWPTISYYFSESTWIQGLLYMSIGGYIFIYICRKLRKPNEKRDIISWYKQHDKSVIICEIMRVTSCLFLIFNILFGVITPLFGEGVRYVSALGTLYAIGGYVILSFLVMLTPLMPGSIIDIAGGFLFVFVLVLNHSFHISLAWIIAVFSIILLHYCGACAQWFIGSMRVVQFYLNRTLPPELLAASDSVLETANCGTVGLIGYIFLDTANGLNQGRINMRFWTQLCSEWSCIPNAFAVVSLGATIALPAIYPLQYEQIKHSNSSNNNANNTEFKYIFVLLDVLIPLLALIAGLIQFSGLTLAARTLGKSIDTDDYMMAREKWTAVQFFYKVSGYVPSKLGWNADVLQLSSYNTQYPNEYQKCLFEDVMPLQKWYVNALNNKRIKQQRELNKLNYGKNSNRSKISISKLKLLILEKYRNELDNIRNLHYTTIEAQYDKLIKKKWLINPNNPKSNQHFDPMHSNQNINNNYDDDDDINKYFNKQNILKYKYRKILQIILLIIFVITFWISFIRIYWQAAFFDRVAKGIKIFKQTTEWYDWISFTIFLISWCIYNHYEIIQSIKNSGKQFCFIIKCCRINKNIESRFKTPYFDTKRFDKYGNEIIELREKQAFSIVSQISSQNIQNNLYSQHNLNNKENNNNNDNNSPSNIDDDDDDGIHDVGF